MRALRPHPAARPPRVLSAASSAAALVVALAIAPAAVVPARAQVDLGPEPLAPVRIMPIGDSITEGDEGGGYRWHLFRMLTEALEMPNFVGHRSGRFNDAPEIIDSDHDGYSAYRIDQIADGGGEGSFWNAPPIEERLQDWDPRIVLLHVGTNDMQQKYYLRGDEELGIPDVAQRLEDLIGRICLGSPGIAVIVAQIIPANPPADPNVELRIRAFNERIPEVVARQQALGRNVTMVDMHTPLLAFPNPDGIHPSPQGYRRMAEIWFEAIAAIRPGGRIANFDPGRDDGVHQGEYYSTVSTRPWLPGPASLIRAGAATLARTAHTGYDGDLGSPELLTDGTAAGATQEGDNTWTSVYVLDTLAAPLGYDVTEIRAASGGPAVGEAENVQQAFEVWWSSVDDPTRFVRLGDFHHIVVNERSLASSLVIDRGGDPLMRRVKALQFRFVEPPRRQGGFIGIGARTRYYELEVEGTPSAGTDAGPTRQHGGEPARAASPGGTGLRVSAARAGRPVTAEFTLPVGGQTRLTAYDVRGRKVATILDGWGEGGVHAVPFAGSGLASGVYFLRLEAGTTVATTRCVLVR